MVLGFVSWVVNLEVFGRRFWGPGSSVLVPGVLGLRSQVLGSSVLILDYALITLQRNLFTEVTGNRVSKIRQETSV